MDKFETLKESLLKLRDEYSKELVITERGVAFRKDGPPYIGAHKIIERYRMNDNDWVCSLDNRYKSIGFERLQIAETRSFGNPLDNSMANSSSIEGRIHDTVLSGTFLSGFLKKKGYKILIEDDEYPIGDRDILLKESPERSAKLINPIGLIDLLLCDRRGNLVIADLKTLTKNYNYNEDKEYEKMFLKMEHVIQLEIYAYILEYMAKKKNIELKIDHTIIIGYDNTGKRFKRGMWKFDRDPKLWLEKEDPEVKMLVCYPYEKDKEKKYQEVRRHGHPIRFTTEKI